MNKKRFEKELNLVVNNKAVNPYFIENLFIKEKTSLFNNEKIENLITSNFSKLLDGIEVGNVGTIIDTLYNHESMQSFLKREDTLKHILDNVSSADFEDIISRGELKEEAQQYIYNNFDFVLDNYPIKKIVEIYKNMKLDDAMKEKMNGYFESKKDQFIYEILTKILSVERNGNKQQVNDTIKRVSKIIDKVLEKENARIIDIKIIGNGTYSNVLKIGNTVVKFGTPRKTFNVPNDERFLQPYLRKDLSEELGIGVSIEICDMVDTNISISEEEMYSIYKEIRDRGIIYADMKYNNVGRLIKDNPPRNSENNGMIGNVSNTLKAGEYVIIDTDFIYKEGDPNIKFGNYLAEQFESRYQKEKLKNKDNMNVVQNSIKK